MKFLYIVFNDHCSITFKGDNYNPFLHVCYYIQKKISHNVRSVFKRNKAISSPICNLTVEGMHVQ